MNLRPRPPGSDALHGYSLHAMERMEQRHGVQPSREEWAAAAAAIRAGEAIALDDSRTVPGTQIWQVKIGPVVARVAWRDDTIITVLKPTVAAVRSAAFRASKVKQSHRMAGRFLRGKRQKARTQWAPGARQPEHDDDEEAAEA